MRLLTLANIISEAGVLTSGRSEAVSSPAPDHHLKRTRYVHQVFLLAGSILKLEAFEAHQASAGPCQKENWDAAMRMSSKQFAFWSLVMDLEMLQCRFVRMYMQVIDELCGWLFIFDQIHHSRWLPIHVKDIVELERSTHMS